MNSHRRAFGRVMSSRSSKISGELTLGYYRQMDVIFVRAVKNN